MRNTLDQLRVVLIDVRNPLNIGAAARAISNFGAHRLRLVNPYQVAFREARSAVGAAKLLADAQEFTTLAEAVADCTMVVGTTAANRRELQHPLRRLEDGARVIRKRLLAGPVALLFGSEKFGISNHDMAHCHWLMRIPTRENHPSMNLGQAVAICMYELVRQAKPSASPNKKLLVPTRDLERITLTLIDALKHSGYIKPRIADSTESKVRRLVRRLRFEPQDAELYLGMLRQILWKLTADKKKELHCE